jgi:hypothetical protein
MSVFASIDGVAGPDVATNSGWADFCKWVAEISGVDDLRHLTEFGWYEDDDWSEIADDLRQAIEAGEPTPDQQSIAEGLLKIVEDAGDGTVLVVSDGTGEGEED